MLQSRADCLKILELSLVESAKASHRPVWTPEAPGSAGRQLTIPLGARRKEGSRGRSPDHVTLPSQWPAQMETSEVAEDEVAVSRWTEPGGGGLRWTGAAKPLAGFGD